MNTKQVKTKINKIADKTEDTMEKGSIKTQGLIEKGKETFHNAADTVHEKTENARSKVKKRPLLSMVGSFFIGSLIGAATALVAGIWHHKKQEG